MAEHIPEEAKNFKLLGHDSSAAWGGGSIVEIHKGFAYVGAVGSAILDVDYGSLTGHVALVRFYQHVDATDTAAEHQVWVDRIARSIEHAGDGSRSKPYPVISASEAQAFLKLRNMTSVGSMKVRPM